MHTDPISDFLTRIRNASRAGKEICVAPHSKFKAGIAAILKNEGFIRDFSDGKDDRGHKTLELTLKYVDGEPAINGIDRVSRPGLRLYFKSQEIPRVLNGLGISILTTPRGLMKNSDARRKKIGGEVVCNVW
ncbi:30S ribosomal protein S8 [Puniceicoccaceae bacterium K14]|nr:30S ribosomal protein S8 [Puniceicoccaceae bacterium K14]